MGESDLQKLTNLLKRLEKLQQSGDAMPSEDVEQAIASVQAMIDNANKKNGASKPDPAPSVARDKIDIEGSVGPGTTVGDGTTHNYGDLAGRDIIREGGVVINNPRKVEISGSGKVTKVRGASDVSKTEKDYLMHLRSNARRVPLGRLESHMSMPTHNDLDIKLHDIYVPLDVLRTQSALQRDNSAQGERVPVPVLSVLSLARQKRFVLLGDPGAGKTTFLNYLILSMVGARLFPEHDFLHKLNVPQKNRRPATNWKHGVLLPIRINLRDFAQNISKKEKVGTATLVWKHIVSQLELHELGKFKNKMKEALIAGKCLVMFDGLDEIIDPRQREVVRDAITHFSNLYEGCLFIVTCRILSYTDPAWQLRKFTSVTLAPLSESSINIFIDKWYYALAKMNYIESHEIKPRSRQLRDAAIHLHDLAQNPMLLTVMAVVHTYKRSLPRERAKLYNDCVNLLLWEWQRDKPTSTGWEPGIVQQLETREERLINGLCEIAYEAHGSQDGVSSMVRIPEQTIMGILQHYLDNDWGKAQAFCKYVEQRAGLLIGRGLDKSKKRIYSFPHRGFQEFLAARYIVTNRDFARSAVSLAAQGDVWHEVLLLATGHLVYNMADVYRPLNAISALCKTKPESDADWRQVWWAAEMLTIVGRSVAEADAFEGKEAVPRLLKYLSALVDQEHLTPVERAQAADALGWLGDPRPGVCERNPLMIAIPGSRYMIGKDEKSAGMVIKPFYLAKYPVTNAQFRRFLDQGYDESKYWSKEGLKWRENASRLRSYVDDPMWGTDNRPVVGVTWHEAVAYANWLRVETNKPYRLPTEAEWEYAASGRQGRKYAFGNRARDESLNSRETGIGQTTAVGIFKTDVTPEGIHDMSGNVWEWCSSLAKDFPYKSSDGRENLNKPGARVLRGGAYDNTHAQIHMQTRHKVEPHARVTLIGFRLAMSAKK